MGWFRAQQARSAQLQKKLASLGLAAVLSYGASRGGLERVQGPSLRFPP